MMEQITPAVSIQYLKKMGISTLTQRDENLALALGGLDNGISPLEMAGAYSTIANDGIYIEPTFYSKVTTNAGEMIIKSTQKTRKVFSKAVASVMKQLLTQPVKGVNGTATYCAISGMDVAAKTGTTNEDYDRWLCGFTNYYTAVTWFGFDKSESIHYNGKNPAGLIWAAVMTNLHRNLENSKFEVASGVVTQEICKDSLKVANSACKDTYTEYFLQGNVPEVCTKHKGSLLKNNEITVDEDTKQTIKDLVKDTIKDVKNEINSDEVTQTPEVPTSESNSESQSEVPNSVSDRQVETEQESDEISNTESEEEMENEVTENEENSLTENNVTNELENELENEVQ